VRAAAGFEGTWFVVPTPFAEDGSLDLKSQRGLVEAAISWGVDGLTVMGFTSEAAGLSEDERHEALGAIAESVSGRVPFVVGCSAGNPDAVTTLITDARRRGAAAAMVAAPPGMGNARDLTSFYGQCAERGGLSLVIQDEPGTTGVAMQVAVLLECLQYAGARTVKLEAPPTAPKIAAILEADPDLRVFGGLGGAYTLAELRAGACGTMTGFAFPEIMAAIRRAAERDDWSQAAAVHDRYLPLIQFEAQPVVGLAVRKELLRRRGVIDTAHCRRDPKTIDHVTIRELDDVLARVGVQPGAAPLAPVEISPAAAPYGRHAGDGRTETPTGTG
jgi:4-hydroxy-tetrahydrodipicolinate synthase